MTIGKHTKISLCSTSNQSKADSISSSSLCQYQLSLAILASLLRIFRGVGISYKVDFAHLRGGILIVKDSSERRIKLEEKGRECN